MRRLIAPLLAVAVLAGCSSKPATSRAGAASPVPSWSSVFGGATVAAPSTPATPPSPAWYADARDIVIALSQAGAACGSAEPVDDPAPPALTLVDCGDSTSIATYRSRADAEKGVQKIFAVLAGGSLDGTKSIDAYAVLGPNWAVNTDNAVYAHDVVQAIGGDYRSLR